MALQLASILTMRCLDKLGMKICYETFVENVFFWTTFSYRMTKPDSGPPFGGPLSGFRN